MAIHVSTAYGALLFSYWTPHTPIDGDPVSPFYMDGYLRHRAGSSVNRWMANEIIQTQQIHSLVVGNEFRLTPQEKEWIFEALRAWLAGEKIFPKLYE